MRKDTAAVIAILFMTFTACVQAQQKVINILSVNDMHSAIEQFPKFAAVVDSLRKEDPELIVLGAGDNRTGNPYNDRYSIPAYPMVALMNATGFNATAIGNHEWDSGVKGLGTLIDLSSFPYLCCNVEIPDSINLDIKPYTFLNAHGIRIGILGAIQTSVNGIPESHPKNIEGLSFSKADSVIAQYRWMRQQCDYLILLSHTGYETDIELAHRYPFLDQIIGGHTHTLAEPNDFHDGVLITQALNKLKYATHTTVILNEGKVQSKVSEQICLQDRVHEDESTKALLNVFWQNPELSRQVATAAADFNIAEELGCLMCDAILEETESDIALQNGGGVRLSSFPAGPITVNDILRLDPFGNEAIVFELTGKEVAEMILNCFNTDAHQIPYVGGITYEMTVDAEKNGKSITLKNMDGSRFDMKKKYRLATNSYVAAILPTPDGSSGTSCYTTCSDLLMNYLQKHLNIDYQGIKRASIIK